MGIFDELGEDAAEVFRVQESDLAAVSARVRRFAQQRRARVDELRDLLLTVTHLKGQVMDTRPSLLQELSDRRVLAGRLEEFDAGLTGPEDRDLDLLGRDLVDRLKSQAEALGPLWQRRVERRDGDADVVQLLNGLVGHVLMQEDPRRRMLGTGAPRGEDERALPELPEVETVRAGAAPHLVGRRVRAVHLQREDLRWPMPADALQGLVGRRCTALDRRSKYILARFDGPASPVAMIHLGMTGRMIVEVVKPRTRRPDYRKHEHWRMDFGDRLVRFVDPRRFGALDVTPDADLNGHPLIRELGVEPLEEGFDGEFLHRVTRGRKVAIKQLLMNAKVVVGVGNIYASESCWHARVRPRRAAKSLTRRECDALAAATVKVLSAAIAAGGTSFRDYVGVDEDAGYFARELRVYERAGDACPRCGDLVKRAVQQGRSTYWCSGCQR